MDKDIAGKIYDFFAAKKVRKYKRKEIVLRADDIPPGVFYVKKGLIRQYYITQGGSEFTLNIFKSGSYFPMAWAVADIKNLNYYEAMTEAELYLASKADLLNFVNNNPAVLMELMRRIYIGIEGLWIRMEALMAKNSSAKVATVLWIFAKRFGQEKGGKYLVDFKLTEQEIASYAGLARESVSRILQNFKKQKIAEHTKGIYSIDLTLIESERDKI